MPRRELQIDDDLSRMLDDLVAAGRYPTADAAVDAGLRLLAARDAAREQELERIRAEILVGLQAADRGELIDGEAFFAELRARRTRQAG